MQTIFVKLSDAWPLIQDSDLLLWRGKGWISAFGRGLHYHASKLAWWNDDLMVIDTHWRRGGDVRLLASDVQRNSGHLDWFKVNPLNLPYDREGAVRYMRHLVGKQYGFGNVIRAFLRHAIITRRVLTPEIDDDATSKTTPFCSDACSGADRIGGGHDPVPFAADAGTEPSDLARSEFYQYRGTLVWDAKQADKVSLPVEPKPLFSVPFLSLGV